MQSYNLEPYTNQAQEQNVNEQYKKELGMRKMLFKYEHENQQLKNQIKALTERLEIIMASKSHQQSLSPIKNASQDQHDILSADKSAQEKLEKYWRQQMQFYYKRIQEVNSEISTHKQILDEQKEQQYTKLVNRIKVNEKGLNQLREKIKKFEKEDSHDQQEQINSSPANIKIGNLSEEQYETQLVQELEATRKRIRQMERARNDAAKANRERHLHIVNLSSKTRELTSPKKNSLSAFELYEKQRESSPKKGGLWGLQLTEENYQAIKQQFTELQRAKTVMLNSIKIQNKNLKEKLVELKNQYIDISTSANMQMDRSLNLSTIKRRTPKKISLSARKNKEQQSIQLPEIPAALGKSAYERKNDKNFVEKKSKIVEWQVNGYKRGVPGLAWNDENCKSPITGINLWMDKYLLGLQFIHTLNQSNQHLHLQSNKKITPIQYRLNNNDYLQNIVLIIMNNPPKPDTPKDTIVGIELISKNGRKDIFGQKVGSAGTQKFDFNIKTPEKPIYSFGSFTINSKSGVSCVNKLGLVII